MCRHLTAIVRVYMQVRKSDYWAGACHTWSNGGAVTISTSGNRNTSGWPLYITSNNKLPRHSRKMAYEERDEAPSLYISYMVYMIITQTRCTTVLLLVVILEERCRHRRPSTSGSQPGERNLTPAQNAKSNPIQSDGTYTCRRNNLSVLTQLWEIRSGPILV